MARRSSNVDEVNTVADVEDVEDISVVDEEGNTADEKPAKAPKAKKEPKRGQLPEGYVTPVGLAKAINEKGLYANRAGVVTDVAPQMVYSYVNNAPADAPYPYEEVVDSIGATRKVAKLENALAWWIAKNERAAERRANAANKAAAKAEKAASKASGEAAEGDDVAVAEEAE